MIKNKETFIVTIADKQVTMAAIRPTQKNLANAQLQYNIAWNEAIKNEAPLKAKLEIIAREQGLWSDKMAETEENLRTDIARLERQLKAGGMKRSQGKNIAMEIREKRQELRKLRKPLDDLDSNSAESQGENARFNYLVSQCLVYNDSGNPYFLSLEEYLNSEANEVTEKGIPLLMALIYNYDKDFEKKLPENKFLIDYGFVNDNLRFIDNKGRLVDEDGRLVNENGRFINEDGEFVDKWGNLVDEEDKPIIDCKPFLDDETGNEIAILKAE